MRKTLTSINKFLSSINVDKGPLVSTIAYLLISTMAPSRSILFVISFIYFVYLIYCTGSILKTIFYSFLPFWLFDVGRIFSYIVIPPGIISNPIYPNGRSIDFVFSPFFVISIITIIILYILIARFLFGNNRRFGILGNSATKKFNCIYLLFFMITFALFFLSSLLTNFLPNLSTLYTLEEYSFLCWMFLTIIYFRSLPKKEVTKMLITFFFILFSMLVFETAITYLQYIKRDVIGLTIEKQTTIPTFGFGADEDSHSFRPIGLNYHANSLGNWQISLLCTIVILWLSIKKFIPRKISNFTLSFSVLFSVSIIMLTISRSAFLSLAVYLSILLFYNYTNTIKAIKLILNFFSRFKLLILMASLFFAYLIANRAYYSLFSLSGTGGLTTRNNQFGEAIQILRSSPLVGVGNKMYIPALYNYIPDGTVNYFPEYVHNGFILVIVERGILATTAYLIGLYYLFKTIKISFFPKNLKIVIIAGFFAVYTTMLFQPFVNLFSLNILITCILLDIKNND